MFCMDYSWCRGASIGWHSDDNRPYLKQRDFAVRSLLLVVFFCRYLLHIVNFMLSTMYCFVLQLPVISIANKCRKYTLPLPGVGEYAGQTKADSHYSHLVWRTKADFCSNSSSIT